MNCPSKKVLLVLPEAFNCSGGIQIFCRALCLAAGKWAQQSGSSVSALVLNDGSAPDTRYVNGGFGSYVGAGKSKAKFVRQYLKQVGAERYDMILFGHVSLTPLALIAHALNPATRIGVIAYGIEVWQPLGKLQRMALQRADVVLAISDFTKEELVRHGSAPAEKVKIFPCSLDPHWQLTQSAAEAPSGPPVMLTVARMNTEDRYKGIDSVLKSLPVILREAGPIEYRIVGQGSDVPRLRALASGLGVDRRVNFLGALSDAELREEYRRCSVFIMPSKKEGFGIVFLEAMAYGKPVIGGAYGGTPSVVMDGETGLLVDSADVPLMADSVARLLGDAAAREKFGRAGYKRLLDKFTFERFERNLQEVLNSPGGIGKL